MKAAIYHFTDVSDKRPETYKKQLRELESFASSLGFDDADVFCDMSLNVSEHTEWDRFIMNKSDYEVLIIKSFYHLSKNTGRCFELLKNLKEDGIKVYTLDNGTFSWDDPPLDKKLRIATYFCYCGSASEEKEIIPVKNDIFSLFVKKKTSWDIKDRYQDRSLHQIDGEQVNIKDLIYNRKKYDILLVHNLCDLHWRTSNFCKIRESLQMDIYSLQEGFLKYDELR